MVKATYPKLPDIESVSDSNQTVTKQYLLQIPITVGQLIGTIQVCADITHTPQSPYDPAFEHQLSQSIQRTITDYVKVHGIPKVKYDPDHPRFILGINDSPDAPFQANIGNHATLIDSISVYIPYAYDSITSQQESVDKISYGTEVMVYFQWRIKDGRSSEPQAEAWVSVAIEDVDCDGFDTYLKSKADTFVTSSNLGTLENLIETFDEKPAHIQDCFRPRSNEPFDLDLEIHDGFIVLKVTKLIDAETLNKITTSFQQQQLVRNEIDLGQTQFNLGMIGAVLHNNSLVRIRANLETKAQPAIKDASPIMTIEECVAYNKDTVVTKSNAKISGLVVCGLGLLAGSMFMSDKNSAFERAIVSVAMAFLTGPLGALTGFL